MCTAKTPITVLQEMLMKMKKVPDYQCIAQSGPKHSMSFEFRCIALGAVVTATAKSKKEAKQEAARRMLSVLAARGEPVPPPYCLQQICPSTSAPQTTPTSGTSIGQYSYVALLKDLCIEYHLPNVNYELVGDSGPPHLRMFTIRARLGQHERLATATSKKAARQQAAEQLYTYMRENIGRLTKDFVKVDAIVSTCEHAMKKNVGMREEQPWRPDLGQRVADYHLDIVIHIDPKKCELARKVLEASEDGDEEAMENVVAAAAEALGLTLAAGQMKSKVDELWVVELRPTSPKLTFVGKTLRAAYGTAANYLRLALSF